MKADVTAPKGGDIRKRVKRFVFTAESEGEERILARMGGLFAHKDFLSLLCYILKRDDQPPDDYKVCLGCFRDTRKPAEFDCEWPDEHTKPENNDA